MTEQIHMSTWSLNEKNSTQYVQIVTTFISGASNLAVQVLHGWFKNNF